MTQYRPPHDEHIDRPIEQLPGPHEQFLTRQEPNSRTLLARLGILVAWVIIVAVLVLKFLPQGQPDPDATAVAPATEQTTVADQPMSDQASAPESPLVLDIRSRVATGLQGRYLVGAAELFPKFETMATEEARRGIRSGSIGERLAYVTVIGAVGSPEDAQHALEFINQEVQRDGYQPTNQESEVLMILEQLYDSSANPLNAQQQDMLVQQLGWFGSLALAQGPMSTTSSQQREETLSQARRTIFIATGFGTLALLGMILGFIGLVLIIIFVCTGRVRSGIATRLTHHSFDGISVETFSFWMLWFSFLQWLASLIGKAVEASPVGSLLLAAAAFAMSIDGLLGWPLIRGVRWKTICEQSGFKSGKSFWVEVMWGVAGYLIALPLLVIGLVLTLLLMQLSQAEFLAGASGHTSAFESVEEPLHPVNLLMVGADVWMYLSILLIGVVCAPIVEELAFRGMFYRHLRGITRRWNLLLSILLSTLVSAFVFAAIHPQGWVTIPVLMSLACAFALLREWRDSLISPMVAHALNNFLVISFGILLLN